MKTCGLVNVCLLCTCTFSIDKLGVDLQILCNIISYSAVYSDRCYLKQLFCILVHLLFNYCCLFWPGNNYLVKALICHLVIANMLLWSCLNHTHQQIFVCVFYIHWPPICLMMNLWKTPLLATVPSSFSNNNKGSCHPHMCS